ncbi:MAG: FAD-binding protein [Actinobacteria bacterium]|nr:MAG: FAD-binding protein [Actinomycetota bacterium]
MRVLVVGAGIGGLSAAIALAQRGIEVELVEVKPVDTPLGIGLVLPANALRGLRELGVLDDCLAAGFPFDRNVFCDPDGRPLVEVPGLIGRDDGLPSLAVHRADLHQLLLAAVEKAGVTVRYGVSVSTVDSAPDAARVRLTNGRTGEYALVLGFDGVNSAMRRYVSDSPAARPRAAGYATWRVAAPRAPEIRCGTLWIPTACTRRYGSGWSGTVARSAPSSTRCPGRPASCTARSRRCCWTRGTGDGWWSPATRHTRRRRT